MSTIELSLSEPVARALDGEDPFEAIMSLDGAVFREHKHRRTMRVELGGRAYFIKIHGHTTALELLKNALRVRWPVLTARNELDAIRRLTALGVSTTPIAGYGRRGRLPSRLESFLITDALDGTVPLDRLGRDWGGLVGRPRWRLQQAVVREVARIARCLHTNGINHRDFYLCHFLAEARDWSRWTPDAPLEIHLIDLHRAQHRRQVPERWIVKDLAGLLFSSLDTGLTSRDYVRFLQAYSGVDWRGFVARRRNVLRRIVRRAVRLYRAEHGTPPRLPAGLASFA